MGETLDCSNVNALLTFGPSQEFAYSKASNSLQMNGTDVSLALAGSVGSFVSNVPNTIGMTSTPLNLIKSVNLGIDSDVNITGRVIISGGENLHVEGTISSNKIKYATISGIGALDGNSLLDGLPILGMTGDNGSPNTLVTTHIPGHRFLVGDFLNVTDIINGATANSVPAGADRYGSVTAYNGVWRITSVSSTTQIIFIVPGQTLSNTYSNSAGVAHTHLRTVGSMSKGIKGAIYTNGGRITLLFDPAFSDDNYFITTTCTSRTDKDTTKFFPFQPFFVATQTVLAQVGGQAKSGSALGLTIHDSNNTLLADSDEPIYVKCEKIY